MDATRRQLIMHRWNVVQHELIPELRDEVGTLTPRLEKVIHTLEWVRIEEFVSSTWCGEGRPRRGEVRPPAKESPIARRRRQTLAQMLARRK